MAQNIVTGKILGDYVWKMWLNDYSSNRSLDYRKIMEYLRSTPGCVVSKASRPNNPRSTRYLYDFDVCKAHAKAYCENQLGYPVSEEIVTDVYTEERKQLACLCMCYLQEFINEYRNDYTGPEYRYDYDSLSICKDCVDAAETVTLTLLDDGDINTEEMRKWARNWAYSYYNKVYCN